MGSCQEEKTPSSAKIWQKIGHEASSLEKKKKMQTVKHTVTFGQKLTINATCHRNNTDNF